MNILNNLKLDFLSFRAIFSFTINQSGVGLLVFRLHPRYNSKVGTLCKRYFGISFKVFLFWYWLEVFEGSGFFASTFSSTPSSLVPVLLVSQTKSRNETKWPLLLEPV